MVKIALLYTSRHESEAEARVMIKVNIQKPSIPLIWLDTAIVIKMAKWIAREKIDEVERERVEYLYKMVLRKTKEEKLICPEGDQQEEIEIGERLEKECKRLQTRLSLGIELMHRQGVEDRLVNKFMEAYINRSTVVDLSYSDLFYKDLLQELKEALHRPFNISVHLPPHKEMRQRRKQGKQAIWSEWEALRKAKLKAGVKFSDQREAELEAFLKGHLQLAKKHFDNISKGEFDVWDFFGAQGFILYGMRWRDLNGQPPGLEGLSLFLLSDHFKAIPAIEIAATLRAKISTSPQPIRSGDSLDIDQLSTILPFFDLVITDNAMKTHIHSLGYPSLYGVKVCSLRDFEEIKKYLEGL